MSRRHSQYGMPSGQEIQGEAETATAVWTVGRDRGNPIQDFVDHVLVAGEKVDSRYGPTIELLGGRLEVYSGVMVDRENKNPTLGWMEMLQLLAGVFDLEALKRVAPNADHSLFTPSMAYGPRIIGNIRGVIEALRKNPYTRQAVLFIASPTDGATSDLPCTLTAQFLIRKDYLNLVVSMRSWDLCRGLPYDLVMFSGLLHAVGRCLDIGTYKIIVNAGSAHVYTNWIHLVPQTGSSVWGFTPEVPRNWVDLSNWAKFQIPLLEKGGTPEGVEFFQR